MAILLQKHEIIFKFNSGKTKTPLFGDIHHFKRRKAVRGTVVVKHLWNELLAVFGDYVCDLRGAAEKFEEISIALSPMPSAAEPIFLSIPLPKRIFGLRE